MGTPVTDTFLDDHATQLLKGDLNTIAASSTDLLRIARREVSPPGGKAARNPNTPGSRPPVNIGALSVSESIRACLTDWAINLRDDLGIPLPSIRDDKGLAIHLRYHAHRIAQRPWAEDCAHEISRWASTIQTMTTPPPVKNLDDYTPEQRREGMATAKVSAAMCADLVAEYTKGEHTPTPDKIREWGRRGTIDAFGPKSCRVYSVAQVLHQVRHAGTTRLDR